MRYKSLPIQRYNIFLRSLLIRRFDKFMRRIANLGKYFILRIFSFLEILNRFGELYENSMAATMVTTVDAEDNEDRLRRQSQPNAVNPECTCRRNNVR